MKKLSLSVAFAVAVALLPVAAQADPDPIDVTVTVLRFIQVQDPDPGPGQADGDYYAQVRIGGFDFQSSFDIHQDDVADISPNWTFTRTVDDSLGSVPITIQMWDHDEGSAAPDDIVDINPTDGVQELSLSFDLAGGTWDLLGFANQGFAEGDGDHEDFGLTEGGEAGRILFDISLSSNGDLDGDGIPDGVERFGVRDGTGAVVTNMLALGANPCRKSIAVEIDYMTGAADGHSHRPKDAAVAEAVAAFDAAPVPAVSACPYPGFSTASGIDFLIHVSNSIPEQAVMGLGPDFEAARDSNFNPARRPYFHYAIFVHDQEAGSSSSGLCCNSLKDFIVSLGSWRTNCVNPGADGTLDTAPAGDDVVSGSDIFNGPDRTCDSTATGDDGQTIPVGTGAANDQVGTVRDQSGTIMHELGHSLGLGHGGADGVNYKPNYLSVMNYRFDPGGIFDVTGASRIDYSRAALPTLAETALNEGLGIANGTDVTAWIDLAGNFQIGGGNVPLDWTGNDFDGNGNAADDNPVNADLNNDGACVSEGPNGTLDTTASGDDVVIGTTIRNGPNHACDTNATGDDKQEVTANVGCVGFGPNAMRDTTPAGDDIIVMSGGTERYMGVGPNFACNTAAAGDDVQLAPVGQTEPGPLTGFDDWSNIVYRGVLSPVAGGADAGHGPEITFEEAFENETLFDERLSPDLELTKTIDETDAAPGDLLTYTVTMENVGTGLATAVQVDDTFPDGELVSRAVDDIPFGDSATENFTFNVPCATADGAVLTNSATVSAENLIGNAEEETSNNTDVASTTIHAPVMEVSKAATGSVNAGEAIAYEITFENTGSGDAEGVVITDTLPVDVYYSLALDLGTGPAPDPVTANADGTYTLTWNVGTVPAGSGPMSIQYTARPSLLFLEEDSVANDVTLSFTNANGCVFAPVGDSETTAISAVAPSADPEGLGFWRKHADLWTAEILARIQATDDRFDGDDGTTPSGDLHPSEVEEVLAPGGNMDKVLEEQLLSTYFNLASRRINAGTAIDSRTATRLGLHTVRAAALYAMDTLLLPVEPMNRAQYSDATRVLEEINNNRSEVY